VDGLRTFSFLYQRWFQFLGTLRSEKPPNDRGWKKLTASYSSGQWKNVTNRYLGVKFVIQGKIHYGWVRMSIAVNHSVGDVMTGYPYETIPNKPIISGDIVGDARKTEDRSASRVQPASLATPEPQSATLGALATAVVTSRKIPITLTYHKKAKEKRTLVPTPVTVNGKRAPA
jgi:hypothetical protein